MGEAPLRFVARTVGIVAARALREGAGGMVRSVFERSFYLTLGDQWICVGPPGLGEGPVNVLCDALVSGVPEYALRIGDAVVIDLGAAAVWSPPQPDGWDSAGLAHGLVAFDARLPTELPREGLALLLRPPSNEAECPAVARAAHGPAAALARMVSHADRADTEPLAPLVGLGPGLTPSGDDFLGGAMVALTCLDMMALRNAIWSSLAPLAATHTNDISRAHLAAAAEGYGSGALHDLLDAVIAGDADEMPRRIGILAAVGHTSGWDAMAGAVTVLRAAVRR